jgi:hypothetical protein
MVAPASFEDNLSLPGDALVIGEPVVVVEIDYDGDTLRGLTARCRRPNGSEHVVSASEIEFPLGSQGALHIAA